MNTMEIATKLVSLCKQGENLSAIAALYADDAVSIEAAAMPDGQREVSGKAAIEAKNRWWMDNHEVHAGSITGPWPHGDRFIVGFNYDVTHKPSGKRMQLDEAALYTIQHGRIVREEFFYDAGA